MPTLLPRMFSAYLVMGIGVVGLCATAMALQKQPLSQVKCECKCEKAVDVGGGNVAITNLGSKVFAAPGGDPKACTGLDGTRCKTAYGEGKLGKCSGVVERKRPAKDSDINPPSR
jgi:hypothetical protein